LYFYLPILNLLAFGELASGYPHPWHKTITKPSGFRFVQLRFYYHMFGPTIGSLNIYTRSTSQGALKQVATLAGNYGDAWMRKDVPLNEGVAFQVVVEGVVGNGYTGDIAIDDISMTPGCVPASGKCFLVVFWLSVYVWLVSGKCVWLSSGFILEILVPNNHTFLTLSPPAVKTQ
jgi:hypothetical protein